jgi:hypothetical protein
MSRQGVGIRVCGVGCMPSISQMVLQEKWKEICLLHNFYIIIAQQYLCVNEF